MVERNYFYKEILRGALFLKLSTICSNCLSLNLSGPSRHIRIKRSTLFSLSVVRNGDTSIFITENARSTPVINRGNKRDKLWCFIVQFVIFNPWKVPWNWIAFYQNSFVISPGCCISWLDAILDDLQTRPLRQTLLFLGKNSLTV